MRSKIAGILLVAGLSAVASSLPAAELRPVPGEAPFRQGWCEGRLEKKAPARLVKQPRYQSRAPLYTQLRLGNAPDAFIVAAIDESRGTGKGYDRVYVDANNNGDLTDDPVIQPKSVMQEGVLCLQCEPLDLAVRYKDSGVRQLRVKVEVRRYYDLPSHEVLWVAAYALDQHLEGKLDIGDRKGVAVAIYDSAGDRVESNGCFNDYGADRLRIDLNGDGTLDEKNEDLPLSKVLSINGTLWEMDVDAAGRNIGVRPCSLPTGKVRFGMNLSGKGALEAGSVTVAGIDDPRLAFAGHFSASETLVVPEGAYLVTNAWVAARDSAGNRWVAMFSISKPLTVSRDKESTVSVGAPLKAEPYVEETLKPGAKTCVFLRLTGAGAELYRNVAPDKTRMMPLMKILDAEDIVVADGNMEYG